jgi:hypothetical protein
MLNVVVDCTRFHRELSSPRFQTKGNSSQAGFTPVYTATVGTLKELFSQRCVHDHRLVTTLTLAAPPDPLQLWRPGAMTRRYQSGDPSLSD